MSVNNSIDSMFVAAVIGLPGKQIKELITSLEPRDFGSSSRIIYEALVKCSNQLPDMADRRQVALILLDHLRETGEFEGVERHAVKVMLEGIGAATVDPTGAFRLQRQLIEQRYRHTLLCFHERGADLANNGAITTIDEHLSTGMNELRRLRMRITAKQPQARLKVVS